MKEEPQFGQKLAPSGTMLPHLGQFTIFHRPSIAGLFNKCNVFALFFFVYSHTFAGGQLIHIKYRVKTKR